LYRNRCSLFSLPRSLLRAEKFQPRTEFIAETVQFQPRRVSSEITVPEQLTAIATVKGPEDKTLVSV
jgi:hypothetical protein